MQYDEKTFKELYGCAYLMASTALLMIVMIGIICNVALYVSDITISFVNAWLKELQVIGREKVLEA